MKKGKWFILLLVVLLVLVAAVPVATAAPKPKASDGGETILNDVPEYPTSKCGKFAVCVSKDGSELP